MDYRGASGYIWTRRTIKYALTLAAAFIFLAVLLVEAYTIHQNELRRKEMEKIAGAILGVKVTIAGYYPRPSDHAISMTDVRIGSPPGFNVDTAIQIGNISVRDISEENGQVVFGRVMLDHLIVYMGISQEAITLMPLISGMNTAELKRGVGFKVKMKEVRSTVFVLRPFAIPHDNSLLSVDVDPLTMKNVGGEKGETLGEAAVEILRQAIRLSYREAAKRYYLRAVQLSALQEIQSSLNVGKGFVSVAKNGPSWQPQGDPQR